jgi:hypothetical protein
LARFVKPHGEIAMAGAGLMQEFEGPVPEALAHWWEPDMNSLHSASWWQSHWRTSGIVDVTLADSMPEGWQYWLEWQRVVAPDNQVELRAIETDRGKHLGYVRAVARRRADAKLDEIIQSVPTQYAAQPLFRA